jgi:hypothetical protein
MSRAIGSKNKPLAPFPVFPGLEPRFTTPEAAAFLRRRPITLEIWRSRGNGPRYIKSGGRVLYALSDLLAFEETRSHTSEAA